eukprot:gene13658-16141_t
MWRTKSPQPPDYTRRQAGGCNLHRSRGRSGGEAQAEAKWGPNLKRQERRGTPRPPQGKGWNHERTKRGYPNGDYLEQIDASQGARPRDARKDDLPAQEEIDEDWDLLTGILQEENPERAMPEETLEEWDMLWEFDANPAASPPPPGSPMEDTDEGWALQEGNTQDMRPAEVTPPAETEPMEGMQPPEDARMSSPDRELLQILEAVEERSDRTRATAEEPQQEQELMHR